MSKRAAVVFGNLSNGRAPRLIADRGRVLEPLNISLMDLEADMCRFPTKEENGAQFFCGRPQEHGASYCDDCCKVAFTEEGYQRIVTRKPAGLKQPQNGRVAEPFVMPVMGGLVREVPFS